MVEILLERTDSGSVANILLGDVLVVRVHDGPNARHWAVEERGSLTLDAAELAGDGPRDPCERLLRFCAVALGPTTLRLVLRDAGELPCERLEFLVDVHERPPSNARGLLRRKT